ncbi:hypothetical protein SEA_CANDLE_14 [Mycobacterium phage Candle]|uniref:Scaffolding protein n=2 Tax=Papyrusvirus send513 TaxID=1982556 RepID=A0A4D6T7P0_9CAUD|nr:hypothetical protein SEA_ZENON_15 [Mycobacterium phage Zenon]QCG78121.1 hypothetical protein SEA_CANDLE_14 [Mycobacterium phage Candle]
MKSSEAFALWPIPPFGGETDDDTSGDGAGSGDGAAGGATGTGGTQGSTGKADTSSSSTGDDTDDDDDEFAGLTPTEIKALAKKKAQEAKAAEKARKEAQAKIDAEERKKNDEVTNLRKDVEDRDNTIATLRATVAKQAIEAAIRDDGRWSWHDVEMVATVAAQINPDIAVNDEGKVEGLKAALPKVAKQHPFLVKEDKSSVDNGNQGGNAGGRQQQAGGNGGVTGFQPGQGGTSGGAGNETDTKALAENYPALAGRI